MRDLSGGRRRSAPQFFAASEETHNLQPTRNGDPRAIVGRAGSMGSSANKLARFAIVLPCRHPTRACRTILPHAKSIPRARRRRGRRRLGAARRRRRHRARCSACFDLPLTPTQPRALSYSRTRSRRRRFLAGQLRDDRHCCGRRREAWPRRHVFGNDRESGFATPSATAMSLSSSRARRACTGERRTESKRRLGARLGAVGRLRLAGGVTDVLSATSRGQITPLAERILPTCAEHAARALRVAMPPTRFLSAARAGVVEAARRASGISSAARRRRRPCAVHVASRAGSSFPCAVLLVRLFPHQTTTLRFSATASRAAAGRAG